MPTRITGPTQLVMRNRIQVANIITRISRIADGTIEGDPAMLAVQVRAGLGLLNKALPDLQSVKMDVAGTGKLIIEHRVVYPDGKKARVIDAKPTQMITEDVDG